MSFRRALARTVGGASVMGAIVVATGWPTLVVAQTAPPYAELLRQAEGSTPRLAAGQATVEAAEARIRQAGVRPNPQISVEVANVAGSRPYQGIDGAEITLSASQRFELGGKRAARTGAARSEASAARARQDRDRAQFARDLAVAYIEAEAAQARTHLASEQLELAQADARTTQLFVDAGREANLRAVQSNADAQAARAEVDAANAEQTTALARLSALVGATSSFTSVEPQVLNAAQRLPLPDLPDFSTAPDVLVAQAEREAAAERVRVERSLASPDLTGSAGLRRHEAENAVALVAGVSLSLPLFDRNRGATQAAQAELRAAEARLAAARLEVEATARAGIASAAAAASRLAAARESEAAAAEAYRLARIGYEAGRLPLLELSSARRAVVAARIRTLDARIARARAEAEVARVAGRAPYFGD